MGRLPVVILIVLAAGCAYPRRSTPLAPVTSNIESSQQPTDVWQLTVVGAQIPPRQRSGLPWDEDEGAPDPFVRIYRDDELLWESEPVDDTNEPQWNAQLPDNVWVPRDHELRIELWDKDPAIGDPIGIWRHHGLPETAQPGAEARIMLEGRAMVGIRVDPPRAQRGLGLSLYEVRSDSLVVIEVVRHSPAGRAGVRAGDRIVAIAGQPVEDLGEARAATALSQAGVRQESLTLERNGARVDVELDGSYVWTSM